MSLNLCSDGHTEICYDTPQCPLCDEISEHKGIVEALEDEKSCLQTKIEDLQGQIADNS